MRPPDPLTSLPSEPAYRPGVLVAKARSLAATAEADDLARRFKDAGVDALFFKGLVTQALLYEPVGDQRLFGDLDVIVAPAQYATAESVLLRAGLANKYDGHAPDFGAEHAFSWSAPGRTFPVDLHRRLWGVQLQADAAWRRLWAARRPLETGSARMLVPSPAAQLLLVALHAAHHGDGARTRADLERAIRLGTKAQWHQARALSRELRADEGLAAGLRLSPDGTALLEALELGDVRAHMHHARSAYWGAAPTTEGFARLWAARGFSAKAHLLWAEVRPSPTFMRERAPERWLARRSRRGLVASYPLRWAHLLRYAAVGLRASRRS